MTTGNVLVDSSGWIEFFLDGSKAGKIKASILGTPKEKLFTPTLVLFEVFRTIKKKVDEQKAREAIAHLVDSTTLVELNARTAVFAADLSLACNLAMADAIILATAQLQNAKLKTLDQHFKGLKNAEVL